MKLLARTAAIMFALSLATMASGGTAQASSSTTTGSGDKSVVTDALGTRDAGLADVSGGFLAAAACPAAPYGGGFTTSLGPVGPSLRSEPVHVEPPTQLGTTPPGKCGTCAARRRASSSAGGAAMATEAPSGTRTVEAGLGREGLPTPYGTSAVEPRG